MSLDQSITQTFGAYDGTTDFGGASGLSTSSLLASGSTTTTLSSAFFPLFEGIGNVNVLVNALGLSSASGPGNVIYAFSTLAAASVKVIYTYSPVPEPSAWVGLALLGAGALVYRKRLGA